MARPLSVIPLSRPAYEQFASELIDIMNPSRIFGQNFGNGLSDDDIRRMGLILGDCPIVNAPASFPYAYYRDIAPICGGSSKFTAHMDVSQFTIDDLNLKLSGEGARERVTIVAQHQERPDEHGYISRKFTRHYVLPEDADMETLKALLASDGVLTIEVGRLSQVRGFSKERVVTVRASEDVADDSAIEENGNGN